MLASQGCCSALEGLGGEGSWVYAYVCLYIEL